MSYGIYDCDIRNSAPMFNLELMKLSSYYKSKGEIVAYSMLFHPERFNHFIVGKDRIDEYFNYPIYQYRNIQTVGRFFSPKKYFPMDLVIESQVPDTYLYNKFPERYELTRDQREFYKSQLYAEHLRLSLDGETIWKDFEKQLAGRTTRQSISIYDYDIGRVKDAIEVLKDLTAVPHRKTSKPLLFKFPIRVPTARALEPWLNFTYYQHRVKFIIERILTEEDMEFLIANKDRLHFENIACDISKNITYKDFLSKATTIYKQLYFLRTILRKFSLTYNGDFFPNVEWENFITLINSYARSKGRVVMGKRVLFETFYEYLKFYYLREEDMEGITLDDVKESFIFIAQENYELFKLFYEYEGEEK